MKFFIDFTAKNDKTFSHLYQRLHHVLGDNVDNLAFLFPGYAYDGKLHQGTLGKVIRVFSICENTLKLMINNPKLARLENSYTCSEVMPVPEKVVAHVNLKRKQKKTLSDMRRLARRAVQSGRAATEKEAMDKMTFIDRFNGLPWVSMRSSSTKQTYPLHIGVSFYKEPQTGKFDGFGLSSTATVPFF